MEYRVKQTGKETVRFKDKNGNIWNCLSPGEYRTLTGTKRICADLKKKDSESMELRLTDGSAQTGLYRYKTEKKWHEKIIGYIPVDIEETQEGYVRVTAFSPIRGILFPLLLLAAVLGVAFGIYWYANKDKMPGLERNAVSYNVSGVENKDPKSLLFPGIEKISVEAGSTHVEHILANVKGNPAYLKYRIIIKDTEEQLYESGWLEPGTALMEFELEKTLEKGEYPAVIEIDTRSLTDHTQKLNGGRLEITLEVF